MSGQKQNKATGIGGTGSGSGAPEGCDNTQRAEVVKKMLKKTEQSLKVNVVYGAHDLDMDLAGLTVEEIQLSLRDVLSVEEGAEAYINGEIVTDKSVTLQAGQRLEFMKEAGQKGVS